MVPLGLVLGTDGKPTACIPDEETSTAGFPDPTCAAMLRFGRFEPALDASGAPVASFYTTLINFYLPQ